MSTKTTNLEMTLLAEEDNFDTNVYNENFQKTDDKIGELNSMLGSEELTTTSQTHSGAINELNKNWNLKKIGEITCNFVNNPVINSLKRTGNTVEIALKVAGEVTNTTTSIGTVPMDFRPKEDAYILGRCIYDKTTWISLIYKIASDGNIYQAEYNNASITNIALAGSYCVL